MLQPRKLQAITRQHARPSSRRYLSFSSVSRSEPESNTFSKEPPAMDPSYNALFKDIDMSIKKSKLATRASQNSFEPMSASIPHDDPDWDTVHDPSMGRKSPAAAFGSDHQLGSVLLPLELQRAINMVLSEVDRYQLREDAQRIFTDESSRWKTTFDEHYRSYSQASRKGERDGAAFAAIALPAHYSAIHAVLENVKHRLGPGHRVTSVMDWGSALGSGFWAASYAFQKPRNPQSVQTDDPERYIHNSTVTSYTGFDKRDMLTRVAHRLLQNTEFDKTTASFKKAYNSEDDSVSRSEGGETLALSAFALSSMRVPLDRKLQVKDMWDSGAELMVIMDHATPEGFDCVAQARQLLLRFAKKEFEDTEMDESDIRGAHVLAPCPHDGVCPLVQPGATSRKLICGFTQRFHRPESLRKTKHVKIGHENMGYTYVVIRRGPRPELPTGPKVGRVGNVGLRDTAREAQKQVERTEARQPRKPGVTPAKDKQPEVENEVDVAAETVALPESDAAAAKALEELESNLRVESYHWSRIVFPPVKAHKHIIMDSCTAEGNIMRLTVPKSQGKQEYYDARKSSWGDIFPHQPKNPGVIRRVPVSSLSGNDNASGQDIGKQLKPKEKFHKDAEKLQTYSGIADDIKDTWKKSRRDHMRDQKRREASEPSSAFDNVDISPQEVEEYRREHDFLSQ